MSLEAMMEVVERIKTMDIDQHHDSHDWAVDVLASLTVVISNEEYAFVPKSIQGCVEAIIASAPVGLKAKAHKAIKDTL